MREREAGCDVVRGGRVWLRLRGALKKYQLRRGKEGEGEGEEEEEEAFDVQSTRCDRNQLKGKHT